MNFFRFLSLAFFASVSFSVPYLLAEPIVFHRTETTPKKVHVQVPVEFSRRVCVDWVDTPHTVMRSQFVPCGFSYYRGGNRWCFVGYFPVTTYTRDCVKHEKQTSSEVRDVVLKFKKGTDIPKNELEEYIINASQKEFNSNRISVHVDPVRTAQPYVIQSKGRRVVIKALKN